MSNSFYCCCLLLKFLQENSRVGDRLYDKRRMEKGTPAKNDRVKWCMESFRKHIQVQPRLKRIYSGHTSLLNMLSADHLQW